MADALPSRAPAQMRPSVDHRSACATRPCSAQSSPRLQAAVHITGVDGRPRGRRSAVWAAPARRAAGAQRVGRVCLCRLPGAAFSHHTWRRSPRPASAAATERARRLPSSFAEVRYLAPGLLGRAPFDIVLRAGARACRPARGGRCSASSAVPAATPLSALVSPGPRRRPAGPSPWGRAGCFPVTPLGGGPHPLLGLVVPAVLQQVGERGRRPAGVLFGGLPQPALGGGRRCFWGAA